MRKFFTSSPIWQMEGIAVIRIITGLFLISHGWEVFDPAKMKEYSAWEIFKNTASPSFMVYAGKAAELLAGFLLLLGLFTRLASIIIVITFLYISFFVGHGKIWYEDQHPFLFVLLGLIFFFTGAGRWSVDKLVFDKKINNTTT